MSRKIFKILGVTLLFPLLLLVAGYFYLGYQAKGNYFTSEGSEIHYTDEGEGVPIILVHGFAANADLNWRRTGIYRRLRKEGFRVIAMDVRGHGLSDKPHRSEAYGDNMVKDVVNLVNHLRIKKAHLVGYSLGGFIALKCAVEYPGYWITVTPMASGWEDPENSKLIYGLEKAIYDLESGNPSGPLIDYFDQSGKMRTGFLQKQLFKIIITRFNDVDALIAIAKSSPALRIEKEQLERVSLPIHSIIGNKDPFVESAEAMCRYIPDCPLDIIPGEDHITLPSKKPAKDALVNFLKEHSNRNPTTLFGDVDI